MYKNYSYLVFILFLFNLNILKAQTTYVPDNNFEQALIDQGYDDVLDDYVLTSNISTIIALNLSKKNRNDPTKLIRDLTGIQDFESLESLNCKNNLIRNLDMSQNKQLKYLKCYYNAIQSLNISGNPELEILNCRNNQIQNLNIDNNAKLKVLNCIQNSLGILNLAQNSDLTTLYCANNNIYDLDLSKNKNLELINCNRNYQMISLNVNNGTNSLITNFDAILTFDLECIIVDNAETANAGLSPYVNWKKHITTSYCENDLKTYVPDDNFEQALIDLDYDDVLDDYVLTSNISDVIELEIIWKGIADLTGIEGFVSLKKLNCDGNQLTSLDVTQNTVLSYLNCDGNQLTRLDLSRNTVLNTLLCRTKQLTSLDVSQNTDLRLLYCEGNQLTSLDVSQNIVLEKLACGTNELTSLDLTQNTILNSLSCYNNQLTSLDVTQNADLEGIKCYNNQLTSLDVSQNTLLKTLDCTNNQLTSLDVSQNTILKTLYCSTNQLVSLDVSQNIVLEYLHCKINQLTSLDLTQNTVLSILNCSTNQLTSLGVSQNTDLKYLDCSTNQLVSLDVSQNRLWQKLDSSKNPSLTCIQVDDADAANAGESPYINWEKDSWAIYSEDCNSITTIPDDNFEQALIDQGYDDVLDNYILTSNISGIIELYISNQGIADLTGIEDFTSLQELGCDNNQLVSLELTQNTDLLFLDCSINPLTNLNVTQNIHLDELFCGNTQLTSLDLSKNGGLFFLNCNYTLLTSLNLKNKSLQDYSEMNMGYNPDLACIEVDDEDYINSPEFDLPWYKDDHTIYANDCNNVGKTNIPDDNFEQALIDLGHDDVLNDYVFTVNISNIVELDISSKGIIDLTGIQDFKSLRSLKCNDNRLARVDVSQNIELRNLRCQENQLTSLDLSKNKALGSLSCRNNPITTLDLSQNKALTLLRCNKTQLTVLDLSENSKLKVLVCSHNKLVSLNVKNGANSLITDFNATRNPNLNCIQVDNANDAIAGTAPYDNWTTDAMATYSEACSYPAQAKAALNIEKEVLSDVITLYPNPVTGILNIDSGSLSLIKIEIYSILGQKVKEIRADLNAIEISDLSSGVYLIRLYSKKGISMKKIIKE